MQSHTLKFFSFGGLKLKGEKRRESGSAVMLWLDQLQVQNIDSGSIEYLRPCASKGCLDYHALRQRNDEVWATCCLSL